MANNSTSVFSGITGVFEEIGGVIGSAGDAYNSFKDNFDSEGRPLGNSESEANTSKPFISNKTLLVGGGVVVFVVVLFVGLLSMSKKASE